MRKRPWIAHLSCGCGILLLVACKAVPHRVETPAPADSTNGGAATAPTTAPQNPPESCYVQIPGGTALRQTPECASAAPPAPTATPAQPDRAPDHGDTPSGPGKTTNTADADANLPLPNLPPLARADRGAPPRASRTAAASRERPANLAEARSTLQNAQNRLDLSPAQLARLRQAQARIDAGDAAGALAILRPLDEELASEVRTYTVRQGGSLRDVAARPEAYGNPDLWPLLWQANRERVADPAHLERGLRLIVPAHPTAAQVAQALDEARRSDLAQAQFPAAHPAQAN